MKQGRNSKYLIAWNLKQRLAEELNDDNLRRCGKCWTLRCSKCNAISLSKKHLQVYFCHKRYCPLCQKIIASKRSKTVAQSVLDLMEKLENEGTPVLPVILTLTMPHNFDDSLQALLIIIRDAWKMLRQGGSKKDYVFNRRHGITCFYRQYFVGEIFSLEMPWNLRTGFHPHYHVLALRHFHKKIPLGVHPWTGAIIDEDAGIRSLWHKYLKIAWEKHYNPNGKEENIHRPYPINVVTEKHIENAQKDIQKAKEYRFPELLSEIPLSKSERKKRLKELKIREIKKLQEQKDLLVGKEIAALMYLRMMYYKDPDNERTVPLSWLMKK